MKKILITGGTGFIGAAISNYFADKGYKITILDNNSVEIGLYLIFVAANILFLLFKFSYIHSE